MKEEDIINDILEKYPEEKILRLCSDTINKSYMSSVKMLKDGKPELAAGPLGEAGFYLRLLQGLSDKKDSTNRDTTIVA